MKKQKSTVGGAREGTGPKPKRTDGATMGLRLSADVRAHIKACATANGQSPADYVEAKFRAEMEG